MMVAPPRLELGTQGSSGLCSTNWAKEPHLEQFYIKYQKITSAVLIIIYLNTIYMWYNYDAWRLGGVVTQRSAKPRTPVQIR